MVSVLVVLMVSAAIATWHACSGAWVGTSGISEMQQKDYLLIISIGIGCMGSISDKIKHIS